MKRINILILTIALGVCGCVKSEVAVVEHNIKGNYKLLIIENCEYFQWNVTHGYMSITHKGNCSNPIHTPFKRDSL